jgi:hypothetical protein
MTNAAEINSEQRLCHDPEGWAGNQTLGGAVRAACVSGRRTQHRNGQRHEGAKPKESHPLAQVVLI